MLSSQDEPSKSKKPRQKTITKYTQIRVKSINFLDKSAVAIYFYDITHHIEALLMEKKAEQKKPNQECSMNY